MVTITPGYDFGVNEVPRAETLQRQATRITVSGLSVGDLDAGLTTLFAGADSETSESLRLGDSAGRMWVSPLGDIWVQEQAGPVILNRVEGGWQTRRYAVKIDTGEPTNNKPGNPVRSGNAWPGNFEDFHRAESGHSTFSDATYWQMAQSPTYDDNRSAVLMGVLADQTSGSLHVNVNVRGLTIFLDKTNVQSTRAHLNNIRRNIIMFRPAGITGGEVFQKQDRITTPPSAFRVWGWVGVEGPHRSSQSDGPSYWYDLEWVGHMQVAQIHMNKNA